jgi:hypothetical protein
LYGVNASIKVPRLISRGNCVERPRIADIIAGGMAVGVPEAALGVGEWFKGQQGKPLTPHRVLEFILTFCIQIYRKSMELLPSNGAANQRVPCPPSRRVWTASARLPCACACALRRAKSPLGSRYKASKGRSCCGGGHQQGAGLGKSS